MMLGVAFGGLSSILSGASLLKIGFMAASAVGLYLLNGKKEKGEVARLSDLKVSSSSYGRGIPIVYGTMRVTGNMFWATDFDEVLKYSNPKNKGGKKGEKKSTPYYEYYANFAMCLCEGPVNALLRIWADSNLIYDKHNPHNPDIVNVGFSQQDSGGGKSGFGMGKKKGNDGGDSGRFGFRFYSGTEEQLQDPFMVQKQGPSMVPAHRGMCYLFFQKFALADFGNRTPTITAEVSVKKKLEITYGVMDNLPDVAGYDIPLGARVFIDPDRYKLYSLEMYRPIGDYVFRVYDLSSSREIKRVTLPEIIELNNLPERIPGWSRGIGFEFIGLTGNGDLIAKCTTGNSCVIAWFDVNTFVMKKWFGRRSNALSNGPNNIVMTRECLPCYYMEVEISLEGEVEIHHRRATLISSFGGNLYLFDYNDNPLAYWKGYVSAFTWDTDNVVPTHGDILELHFVMSHQVNTSNSSVLYRTKVLLPGAYMVAPGQPFNLDPVHEVFRNIRLPNFNFITFSACQVVQGAEAIVWFEHWYHDDHELNGLWAQSVDQITGDLLWRVKVSESSQLYPAGPVGNQLRPLPLNSSNSVKWLQHDSAGTLTQNITRVWEVDFRMHEVSYYDVSPMMPRTTGYMMYWPARGAILSMIKDPDDGGERKWAFAFIDRNSQVPVDVHFIVTDLASRVGIPDVRLDLTKLKTDEIMGYVIENPTSARRIVEELAQIFMFDVVESDYRLKVVSRGQESIATVPQKDLGVIDPETMDYYHEVRIQEIDLPQTVVVSYINAEKDYQVNSQHYRRPRSPMHTMQSRDKLELQLPMSMLMTDAKQLAHKVCMSLWTERITYDTMLPWKYLPYDPTDVLRFQMDDGLTFETRMMKMDIGANFVIDCMGVTQTPAAYTSNAKAGGVGGIIVEPRPWTPQSEPFVADIPYLHDGDDVGPSQFSYYWGAIALGPGLRGSIVQYRVAGLDWDLVGITPQEVVGGTAFGPIPPPAWGPWATDDVTRIRLAPSHPYEDEYGFTYAWESIPESQWPSTENCIIIGREIIYFRDVEIEPNGSVVISHLIRGARGTEEAAHNHTEPTERFAIHTNNLRQHEERMALINQNFGFTAFSTYSLLGQKRFDTFMTGASHKPWGPNFFRRRRSGNNVIIQWEHRTRMGGEMRDGSSSIPVNEESRRCDIFLLSNPYDHDFFDPDNPSTYIRAWLNVTGLSVTYTQAQMLEDGITHDDELHIVGFQISAQVGRGFPGPATLYPSILLEA